MRHGATAAGVALGAVIGLVLGTAHWPIDPSRVSQDLSVGFGAVAAPTRATLTLLPRPTLRLWGLSAETSGLSVTAGSAEATLRFGRLLLGEFSPIGFTLHDADLHIDLDAARSALSRITQRPLSRLIVKGGAVEISRPSLGWSTSASIASAQVDFDGLRGPLRAAGTGRWRGQPLDVSAELDQPLAAAQGQASPLRFSLDAPLAQIRLAGDLTAKGEADGALFRGQASALAPSMTRFLRWFGRTPPEGVPLSGLELAGHATATAQGARIDAATLNWGGQAFEGALDVSRRASSVAISGTLAADTLDLEPLIGPPPTLVDAAGGWSDLPALPSPSPELDLDLRVSASKAVWRGHTLENAAASVSQSQGRLSVKLLEAEFAQGALSGELSVETDAGACRTQLAAAVENADLGGLLGEFGGKSFSGQGSLKIALRARGRSPAQIVAERRRRRHPGGRRRLGLQPQFRGGVAAPQAAADRRGARHERGRDAVRRGAWAHRNQRRRGAFRRRGDAIAGRFAGGDGRDRPDGAGLARACRGARERRRRAIDARRRASRFRAVRTVERPGADAAASPGGLTPRPLPLKPPAVGITRRHCEERSDEAIPSQCEPAGSWSTLRLKPGAVRSPKDGLLRFARNDGALFQLQIALKLRASTGEAHESAAQVL